MTGAFLFKCRITLELLNLVQNNCKYLVQNKSEKSAKKAENLQHLIILILIDIKKPTQSEWVFSEYGGYDET